MQPGARGESTDVGPVHADTVKPGVIFGYRAVSDYGSFGDIYNFGRSTQACMLQLRQEAGETAGDLAQRRKEMLRNKMRRTGLNAPSRILLWARVSDIDKYWDEFKRQVGGWGGRLPVDAGTAEPLITQQLQVGDAYYTVENMGVSEFGTWCKALISKLLEPEQARRSR